MKEGDSTIVDNPREVVAESRHNSTYIVDLMAALRSMVQIPENYEELTWKLLSSFPKGFQRVDIVADTYRNVSIKAGERESHGGGDKIIMKSKVQVFGWALAILQISVIYFSKEDSCVGVNACNNSGRIVVKSRRSGYQGDKYFILHMPPAQPMVQSFYGPPLVTLTS